MNAITPKQVTALRQQCDDLEVKQAKAMHTTCKATFKKLMADLRESGVKISPKTEAIYATMFAQGAAAAIAACTTNKIKSPQVPVIWTVCEQSGRPFHTV